MDEEKKIEKKEGKKPLSTHLAEWIKDIIKVAVLFLLLFLYVFQISTVDGSSMKPTFESGDVVVVDKLTGNICKVFGTNALDKLDVVVLKSPPDPGKDFIKRVIALPGEKIQIENGRVYVDDVLIPDEFVTHPKYEHYGPEEVPKGYYFVLGDNRASSADSRSFGCVPQDYIKGKVRLRLWPFNRIKLFSNPSK